MTAVEPETCSLATTASWTIDAAPEHVLNVVEGIGVEIETAGSIHPLAYAETLVVPAAVGAYSVRRVGTGPVRVVKALVR